MKPTGLLVLFSFFCLIAAAQQPYWQQQVNYNIDVTLNDGDHSLDGHETMEYFNNSADTLPFIWMHLWPNAYKNDRSAYTEQMLGNFSTDFYFSNAAQRGYINRLVFKVNGSIALMEDHPRYQDIVKVYLPVPLAPHQSCKIETPFHVKLPYNFSRGGHIGQAYQITQWYPKAAVYDKKGWHEMPYLDQGEFYSDFGNYEVSITLPDNYVVAATGELVKENTALPTTIENPVITTAVKKEKQPFFPAKKQPAITSTPSSKQFKTVTYQQKDVIDFAWFADKNFIVKKDTLALPSGRIIQVAAYSLPSKSGKDYWINAVKYMKKTVLSRSNLIGEYPYNSVTAVQAATPYTYGMEYPTITLITGVTTERGMEGVIEHELGHNWFYGILASNERMHPWMDEGMNTYYNHFRYKYEPAATVAPKKNEPHFLKDRLPDDYEDFILRYAAAEKKDQPIETSSENASALNYELSAYYKGSLWMKQLQTSLGTTLFDSCMKAYFNQWKFKHPYPEDFLATMKSATGRDLLKESELLKLKGVIGNKSEKDSAVILYPGEKNKHNRPVKFASFFSFKKTDQYKYIFAAPAVGYNKYDQLMIGAMLHNYTLPEEKFQFLIAPMYGTGSKEFNGMARFDYKLKQGDNGEQLTLSLAGASFNGDAFTDSTGKKNFLRFSKIVPGIKYVFANSDPRSRLQRYLQWKTFFISEESLLFSRDTINDADIISYPVLNRYVNQLRFVVDNNRVLYPYNAQLQADQGKNFLRIAFTGNYFFNYAKGGGMNVRLFAGKFFYLGEKTFSKQFETDPYQLNMTGPKGYEDYTYSNYFVGRNEFEGFASQQIMQRDGFFKVRTDLLSSKIGKTDNWLAAANFTSDFPKAFNPLQVLPIKIPLKIFVDAGTYAEAWQQNSNQGKFIYDAGLQLSLLKNVINIYVPILYSKVYRDYINSTITGSKFLKNISFSIDVQNITLKKLLPQFAF